MLVPGGQMLVQTKHVHFLYYRPLLLYLTPGHFHNTRGRVLRQVTLLDKPPAKGLDERQVGVLRLQRIATVYVYVIQEIGYFLLLELVYVVQGNRTAVVPLLYVPDITLVGCVCVLAVLTILPHTFQKPIIIGEHIVQRMVAPIIFYGHPRVPALLELVDYAPDQRAAIAFAFGLLYVVYLDFLPAHFAGGRIESIETDVALFALA